MTTFTLAVNRNVISILVAVHFRANAECDYMDRAPAHGQEAVGSIPTAAKADVAQQNVASTICRPRYGRALTEHSPPTTLNRYFLEKTRSPCMGAEITTSFDVTLLNFGETDLMCRDAKEYATNTVTSPRIAAVIESA